MKWNNHSKYEGTHAFMSASKYHWLNYSDDKMKETYLNALAVERGTKLHEFAHICINLNQRLPDSSITLNAFVNDAIGFGMDSEILLFYSDNCYGTADAIKFEDDKLMIFDLKTGETRAHIEQLLIYAALFCLEYDVKPEELKDIELRIYQFDTHTEDHPDPKEVRSVMNKIVKFSKLIDKTRIGA